MFKHYGVLFFHFQYMIQPWRAALVLVAQFMVRRSMGKYAQFIIFLSSWQISIFCFFLAFDILSD